MKNFKSLTVLASGLLTAGTLIAGPMQTTANLISGAAKDGAKQFQRETCIIPQKFSLGAENYYSTKDEKKETKLCTINLASNPMCPKLNSTNPGVLVISKEDSPNLKPEDTTDSFCRAKKFDVEAKFKQSITCSYTASALAAYHLSRILGSEINTPVAVVRTMEREKHKSISTQALRILGANPNDIIYKSWSQFAKRDSEGTEPKLYVDNGNLLYGALSENIKKESIYTEVSGVGPYETRYDRFKQQGPFKRVSDARGILDLIGADKSVKASLPILQQMRDVSTMIILDTLLSQDDRIGNIHFYLTYASVSADGKYHTDRLSKEEMAYLATKNPGKSFSRWKETDFVSLTEDFKAFRAKQVALPGSKDKPLEPNGVIVREMILKDNDCGVDVEKRSNMMRQIDAIENMRHISLATYKNILTLYAVANDSTGFGDGLRKFFANTLLYRAEDYAKTKKSFLDNLAKVATVLKDNCKKGLLKTDLNLVFDDAGHLQNSEPMACE